MVICADDQVLCSCKSCLEYALSMTVFCTIYMHSYSLSLLVHLQTIQVPFPIYAYIYAFIFTKSSCSSSDYTSAFSYHAMCTALLLFIFRLYKCFFLSKRIRGD